MALILAFKNRSAVVAAADIHEAHAHDKFKPLIQLADGSVLLIAGNLPEVEHTVLKTFMPKMKADDDAADAAKLLHSALRAEIAPNLAKLKGRVEFIVAGMAQMRNDDEPALFYMDSAQEFDLQTVKGDVVAGGTTAAITSVMVGHSFETASIEQLKVLAKECVVATKLRWPPVVAGHVRLGIVTPRGTHVMEAFPAR